MLDPYVGFEDAVAHIPKINSPQVKGSKTAIPERPRSGAKQGPPRYTVVKGAEILAPSQMNNSFSSRGTAE